MKIYIIMQLKIKLLRFSLANRNKKEILYILLTFFKKVLNELL